MRSITHRITTDSSSRPTALDCARIHPRKIANEATRGLHASARPKKRWIKALTVLAVAAIFSPETVYGTLLTFSFTLTGTAQVPPNASPGTGDGTAALDTTSNLFSWDIQYQGLSGSITAVIFHGPAPAGQNAPTRINLGQAPSPVVGSQVVSAQHATELVAGLWYLNVHTTSFPGGEIRGQLLRTDLKIDWYTIDGGGIMNATGGTLGLSGTLGQHDAGPQTPMFGGNLELVGGFWTAAVPVCACPADMNGDDTISGKDIQLFVHCMLGAGSNCACANVDEVGGLDMADISAFVNDLLAFTSCP